MMSRWQYYALVFMFIGSAQSGLLVIANAAPILGKTAGKLEFFCSECLDNRRVRRGCECSRASRHRQLFR